MPTRIRVSLTEHVVDEAGPLAQTGPAVHAALLAAVDAVDPSSAEVLHGNAAKGPKPFSITPLHQGSEQGRWRVEIGLLTDGLVPPVVAGLQQLDLLRLGHSSFRVERIDARGVGYDDLVEHSRPRTRWPLRFRTPTTFRVRADGGPRRGMPLPDPVLVFPALLRRWEAFAGGVALPASTATMALAHLAIGELRIHTDAHLTKGPSAYERGFVGDVEYLAVGVRDAPKAALAGISALVTFATFAGVGDQTTKGMGWVDLAGR